LANESQKTEKPTPRRVQKTREKGQFASSRHFLGGLQFILAVALIDTWFRSWCVGIIELMLALFRRAMTAELNGSQLVYLTREALVRALFPLALGGLAIVGVITGAQLVVTSFGLSLKKLTPDLNRLDPLQKLRSMVRENLAAFVQAAFMAPLFLYLVYQLSSQNLNVYMSLPHTDTVAAAFSVASLVQSLLWKAAVLFVGLGVVDLVWERHKYMKSLRMSKQEIRDELKETEGNMEMKARIKRLIRSMSRRRMLQDVKTATAVIVNPTHFAVALRYEATSSTAPLVVAKGKNQLALRIRATATESNIAIVENPPLAQSLYSSVEVGQEIPVHLYRAVAEVLAHVYKLMNSYSPVRVGP